ncbi:MAG TPA: restriction endonuclease subunit S [Pyrinomonadaceae bacterium]|nr:restriction endonuclease subunit S [Pyrinomonadaceae bacterium]
MELKPGYKQTEVSVIPEEWEVRTLRSLTTLLTNGFVGTATSAYVDNDEGVLYIQGYNIQENGFNYHGIKRVSKSFHARNQKSCLQPGDLLTIQTGDIGVTAVVPPALAGSNCHALVISRLDKRVCEPGFYCQYFNSERGRVAFKEIETGSTMKHLNVGDMKRLLLPFPPIEQQRAIAVALKDVDALLAALDQLIAKKRDLKKGAMQRLITGHQRLPSFTGPWEETTLGEIGNCVIGLTYKPENVVEHGLLVLRSSNVQNGQLAFADNVYVNVPVQDKLVTRAGDILICVRNGSRALIGKCAMIDERGVGLTFGAFMSIYRTKYSQFVFHAFQSHIIQRQIRENIGATINQITNKDMKALRLRLPPEREQAAIATVLSDMDSDLAAVEQRRDKTRALKQGMMQELLTGRTRLV